MGEAVFPADTKARRKLRLPRISTFASAGQGFVVPPDFYRRAGPIVRRINVLLEGLIVVLVLIPPCAVVWLLWGARLEEPYVSDGVHACSPAPVSAAEVSKVNANAQANNGAPSRQRIE